MPASGGIRVDIGPDQHVFIGTDKTLQFDVNQVDGTTAQVMTGWALTWELRTEEGGKVLVTKAVGTGITISNGDGTDDRASIVLADTDTEGLQPQVYYHALRRTDAGSEDVIVFGDFHLLRGPIR